MSSTFTATGSTGGAFETEAGTYAIAESTVTTAEASAIVTFKFTIARRPLWFRVGSTTGAQNIVSEVELQPGDHIQSFIPGVSTYYVHFELREVGDATLSGFARVAAGNMSLPTPWTEAELPALRSEQSLDVQWWVCGTKAPRVLERRGTSSWSLRLFAPIDGPFDSNDRTGTTLTPSARTGTATIAASAAVFKASDVGSLLRLTQRGLYETLTADALDDVTGTIRVTGQGVNRAFDYRITGTFTATWVLQRSVGNELSWVTVATGTGTASASVNDALENQIVYYRLKITAYTSGGPVLELIYSGGVTDGVARIFSVDADNSVTADVLEPFAATTATAEWARGSWSDRNGWPDAVALYDGRLTFVRAGRRWQSSSDNFETFALGSLPADAIAGVIPGALSTPRWLKGGDRLFLGTGGGVGDISSGAFDEVMTPDNARAKIRRARGSDDADAVMADGGPVYIQRSGRKLGLVVEDGDKLQVIDLTRLHRDAAGVGEGAFVELAWQSDPEPRLWAVREDGQMVCQLLNIEERLGGISRIVPAGTAAAVESICFLPGAPEDHGYRVTRRFVNGATVRHVEKLATERWTSSEAAVRLDAAEIYSGASTSTITGLTHLVAESVYVWGNGRVSGPYTVNSSGQITLSYAVTYAVAGLRYQGFYQGPKVGPLVDYKKPDHVMMSILNTVGGGLSWGPDFVTMETLPDRATLNAEYNSALAVFSMDQKYPIASRRERDARICIRHNGVGPSSLAGLIPVLDR